MDSQAIQNQDKKIIDLAKYAASKGGLRIPTREYVTTVFRYYKWLIIKKEFTIDQLIESVFQIHGSPDGEEFKIDLRDITEEERKLIPENEL